MKLHFGIPITNDTWEDYEGEYAGQDLRDIPLPFLIYVFTKDSLKVDESMLVALDKEITRRKHNK